MWCEDYVVSVENPEVKVDYYMVSNLQQVDNKDFKFLYDYNTNLEKIEKFDTKAILINTYNLGNLIDKKFTCIPKDLPEKYRKNITINNVFIHALDDTNIEFNSKRKYIYKQTQRKLNKSLDDNNYTLEERIFIEKEYKRIKTKIYKKRVKEFFEIYKISNNDLEELNNLLDKWVKVCGLPTNKMDLTHNTLDLFPIFLLAHEIYLFIKSEGKKHLEVKIIETLTENNKVKIHLETINDLIYYLALNYFVSGKGYYTTCEVCGKLVSGNKGVKTCSPKCRQIKCRRNKKKKA